MLLRKMRQPEVLSAILAWAVEGCKMWVADYNSGNLMEVPDAVKEEVEEYKTEENHIRQFLEDVVTITKNDKDRFPKPEMYQIYRDWCENNGRRQYYTTHRLTKELKAEGFISKPAQYGSRVRDCWIGIKVNGPQVKTT